MTKRDDAMKRYMLFAAARAIAYFFLAFVLVFGYTPIAIAADASSSSSSASAEPAVPEPSAPVVDFSQLNGAIASAQSSLGMYPVYDSDPSEIDAGVQYVTSSAVGALENAIAQGQSVAYNASATQDQVNSETNALYAAQSQFYASVLVGAKQNVPDQTLAIDGVNIYLKDTDDCIATDLGDYTQVYPEIQEKAHITKKGGYLEFDYVTHWNYGDMSARNDLYRAATALNSTRCKYYTGSMNQTPTFDLRIPLGCDSPRHLFVTVCSLVNSIAICEHMYYQVTAEGSPLGRVQVGMRALGPVCAIISNFFPEGQPSIMGRRPI